MKIPCVRCGKTVESPAMYCKDCQREMKGQTPGIRLGRWLFLLVLCCVAALVVYGFLQPQRMAGWRDALMQQPLVKQVMELANDALQQQPLPPPVQEEQPVATAPGPVTAELADVKTPAPGGGTATAGPVQPPAPDTQNTLTPNGTPDPVAPTPPESAPVPVAPAQEMAPSSQPIEAPVAPQLPPESAAPQAAATEPPEASQQTASKPATVWIYYIKSDSKGRDIHLASQLRQAGYVNAHAKGNWRSSFKDQNVFFRRRDKAAVQELFDALGSGKYESYHYEGERINRMVKDLFAKNPDLEFLVILQ